MKNYDIDILKPKNFTINPMVKNTKKYQEAKKQLVKVFDGLKKLDTMLSNIENDFDEMEAVLKELKKTKPKK